MIAFSLCASLLGCATQEPEKPGWVTLFNGKDLKGWTVRGKAAWSVQDGALVGIGGMGHLYSDATCADFEVEGEHIQFWINGTPVMTWDDAEYKAGHFAIQGHNPGMKIEARRLLYRPLKP